MPDFGLPDATLETVRRILHGYLAVEGAILYGSRAKGDYRKGSDIDLSLKGTQLDTTILAKIAADLDESNIPYQVDLSNWEQIENPGLRDHIDRVGVVFYERKDGRAEALSKP